MFGEVLDAICSFARRKLLLPGFKIYAISTQRDGSVFAHIVSWNDLEGLEEEDDARYPPNREIREEQYHGRRLGWWHDFWYGPHGTVEVTCSDNPQTIDVLVLYTWEAMCLQWDPTWVSSDFYSNCNPEFLFWQTEWMLYNANNAFRESGIDITLRIAGFTSGPSDWNENTRGTAPILTDFRTRHEEQNTRMRKAYGANVMVLLGDFPSNQFGEAYLGPDCDYSYMVVRRDGGPDGLSFAHEIGHILGVEHEHGSCELEDPECMRTAMVSSASVATVCNGPLSNGHCNDTSNNDLGLPPRQPVFTATSAGIMMENACFVARCQAVPSVEDRPSDYLGTIYRASLICTAIISGIILTILGKRRVTQTKEENSASAHMLGKEMTSKQKACILHSQQNASPVLLVPADPSPLTQYVAAC